MSRRPLKGLFVMKDFRQKRERKKENIMHKKKKKKKLVSENIKIG
jgi:hypothetical protein